MYVKKDGTVYNFCSNKCKNNRIDIGRVPRRTRWTNRYSELKTSSLRRGKTAASIKADEERAESNSKKPESKNKAPKKAATKSDRETKKEKPAKKKAPAAASPEK
jgi:large subunit ribosomal protein L24e